MQPKAKPVTQAEHLKKRLAEAAKRAPAIMELRDMLLAIGGTELVAPPSDDPFIGFLVSCGHVMDGVVETKPMEQSGCHVNVARIWRKKPSGLRAIGSGYALPDDGLWRQHTWGIKKDDGILETTEPRTEYYGLRFEGQAADIFAEGQLRLERNQ